MSTIKSFQKSLIVFLFFMLLTESFSLANGVVGLLVTLMLFKLNPGEWEVYKYVNFRTVLIWIKYVGVLLIEVVKANFQVAYIALSFKMPIEPVIIQYNSVLNDSGLLTIFANSITLTPGTMSVDLVGNQLLIHCLNTKYARGIQDSKIESILQEIEGDLNG